MTEEEEQITPPPAVVKPKSALDMTDEEYKIHRAKFMTTKTPPAAKPIDKSKNALNMSDKEYAKHKRENY